MYLVGEASRNRKVRLHTILLPYPSQRLHVQPVLYTWSARPRMVARFAVFCFTSHYSKRGGFICKLASASCPALRSAWMRNVFPWKARLRWDSKEHLPYQRCRSACPLSAGDWCACGMRETFVVVLIASVVLR